MSRNTIHSWLFMTLRAAGVVLLFSWLFMGCSLVERLPQFEKRRLLAVFHLIETEKYRDAKEMIEELMEDEASKEWPRLWYAQGILAQTSYREGKSKNNNALLRLYSDPLYLAWESYEKGLSLDREGRMERSLVPRYILLANDFQQLGEEHFKARRYSASLKAFEQAITVASSPILSAKVDTTLRYNAAMAAYMARNWQRAQHHLETLHQLQYKNNATHMLSVVHLHLEDTLAAKNVLNEGIAMFSFDETLVLLLADLLYRTHEADSASRLLEAAAQSDTTTAVYHYTRGLILQRTGAYAEAISAYGKAYEMDQDNARLPVLIAMCYYNKGVAIEGAARTLTVRSMVDAEKERSTAAFRSANEWLQKAMAHHDKDDDVLLRIHSLNQALRMPGKGGTLNLSPPEK